MTGGFIGKTFFERSAGAFSLGAWVADTYGDAVKPHGHADAHFMFVIAGDYATNAERTPGPSMPTLVFNPRNTFHRDRFLSRHGSFFSLAVHDMALDGEGRAPRAPLMLAGAAAVPLMQRLLRIGACWNDDAEPEAESVALELVAAAARVPGERTMPRWLARTCENLDEEPSRKIRIADLAAAANVHPVHFARTFRNILRCTAGEYLRNVRLRRAARLLSKTRLRLAEVAMESGFADQSHLTHHFSAAYGVAPGRFRALTA